MNQDREVGDMTRREFFQEGWGLAKVFAGLSVVGGALGAFACIGRNNYFIDAKITGDPVYTPHRRGSLLEGDEQSILSFEVMTEHGPKAVNVHFNQEGYRAMLNNGDKVRIWYTDAYKSWFEGFVRQPVLNLYGNNTNLEKIAAQSAQTQNKA